MDDTKYIGMDVHKETISIAVLNSSGKLVMQSVIETKAITIVEYVCGLRGDLHVTLEEGTWEAWLYDLLRPHVNEVLVFVPMLAAPNAFAMEGAPITVRLAEAPAPTPPSVEPAPPDTLFRMPAAVPVTFTEKVHEALAASVAPDMITLPDPALAKIDPPGQDPEIMLGEETCSPAGNVSPKPIALRAIPAFGLVIVKLSVVVP